MCFKHLPNIKSSVCVTDIVVGSTLLPIQVDLAFYVLKFALQLIQTIKGKLTSLWFKSWQSCPYHCPALKRNSNPWTSKLGLWANGIPFLMPPHIWCQKPLHFRQNLVAVKKHSCSIKLKRTWEKNSVYHCKEQWAAPFFPYYSQVYLRSLPNHLMDQQNTFLEYMWRLSGNGCLVIVCTR